MKAFGILEDIYFYFESIFINSRTYNNKFVSSSLCQNIPVKGIMLAWKAIERTKESVISKIW